MTVGELIELLEKYPKDMKVGVMDTSEGMYAGSIAFESINDKKGELVLHTEYETYQ